MKKFLVVLLACALIFGFAATASAADTQIKEFSDIADQSQAAQNAIMKLAVLGVVEGNEGIGGSFRPADNLTRAEFAKIVCYLTGNVKLAESLTNVGTKFSDVSTGNWYTGWVNAAAQSGYFQGDPGGTFRPNANITMQEVVAVALRAAGYTDKLPGSWPGNYVTKAQNVGLLDDVTFVGSSAATRSDMALICNETLGINMVVHIENEIAYALALTGYGNSTVDKDGFAEIYYMSNEDDNTTGIVETILRKAFKGRYYDVQVQPAEASSVATATTITPSLEFDESHGWYYEDFATGELALNVAYEDSIVYAGNKKFEEQKKDGNNDIYYTKEESLASSYYVTGGYDLTDLAAMQVQMTVIDGKEIAFVEVVSSFLYADSIYQDRSSTSATAQNIMVDGKSYRPSNTMYFKSVANVATDGDYASGYNVWDTTNGEVSMLNLRDSYDDDDFPGKVYLDKNGRIYGVKNYDAYNMTPFAIFDDLDSDRANWKELYRSENDNLKIEAKKDFTIYKDGDFIKLEDLEENDAVFRLGSNGAPFFYVATAQEGELTQQTNTKLTLAGTGYKVVDGFMYSDDGGETFTGYDIALKAGGNEVDFGEAEYAKGYNFSRLAWVASNLTNQKLYGVITKIEPAYNWGSGNRENRYEEITIFNSEGKEVTYKFTNDFRDGYTYYVRTNNFFPTSGSWATASNEASKWTAAIKNMTGTNPSVETLSTALAKGDIIQIVVDKNDKVKRIDNYSKFATGGSITAKVSSSNSRITLPSGVGTSTPGTFTLNKDAIVFNVSPDDTGAYDDVDLMSVSSVLAKDFDAAKVVAFETKTGANTTVLYIIGDVSVYQFGIISGRGRDATGDYYTINGKRVYSDSNIATTPSVISYKVSGGEASLHALVGASDGAYLAQKASFYVTNVQALLNDASNDVTDAWAAIGTAISYSSSTKALRIFDITQQKDIYVYITSDTYLYDLIKDDDVSSAADLKDKIVMAFYDKDNNASFVAVVDGTAKTGSTGGVVPPSTGVQDLAAEVGHQAVTLTWTPAADADTVELQISLDGITWYTLTNANNLVADNPSLIGSPLAGAQLDAAIDEDSDEVTVTGLMNGIAYRFQLVVDGGTFEGESNLITATPAVQAAVLTVTTIADQAITLDWDTVTGAGSGPVIEISLNGTTWYPLTSTKLETATPALASTDLADAKLASAITANVDTSKEVNGLVNGTNYHFRLVVASGSFVGTSNEVQARPSDVISDLSVAAEGDEEVGLTWTAAVGASSIKLQISTDGGTTWTDSAQTIGKTASSVTVTGLTNGTTYTFRLVVTGGANAGTSNNDNGTPMHVIDGAELLALIADTFVAPVNGAIVTDLSTPSVTNNDCYTVVGKAWTAGVDSGKFNNTVPAASSDAEYTIVLRSVTGCEFDDNDIQTDLLAAIVTSGNASALTATNDASDTVITIVITYDITP